MDFFKLINFIFSSIFSPKKIWKRDNNFEAYQKKHFIILTIITFSLIFFVYFYHSFSILELTSLKAKIMSIVLHVICDFILSIITFFTIKILLKIFRCNPVSNKKLFLSLYISAVPILFSLIIFRVFPDAFFLAIAGFWSLVLLYDVFNLLFRVDKKKLTLFFILSCMIVISFYTVFSIIIYYILISL